MEQAGNVWWDNFDVITIDGTPHSRIVLLEKREISQSVVGVFDGKGGGRNLMVFIIIVW